MDLDHSDEEEADSAAEVAADAASGEPGGQALVAKTPAGETRWMFWIHMWRHFQICCCKIE